MNFPRIIAKNGKRIVCENIKEFISFVNMYNAKTDLYYSVCAYDDPSDMSSIVLDRVFIDIDNNYDTALKLSEYLVKNNMKHEIRYSGSGESYHFFVYTANYDNLKNPKITLYKIHEEIIRESLGINVSNGLRSMSNARMINGLDTSFVGDISRLCRIPFTFNMGPRALRYCIPISDIRVGEDVIREIARKPIGEVIVIGDNEIDASKYDTGSVILHRDNGIKSKVGDVLPEMVIESLDPCIKEILYKPNPSHTERYLLVYDLADFFLEGNATPADEKEVVDSIIDIIERLDWENYNPVKTHYYVEWCIKKHRTAYSCKQRAQLGVCVGCGKYNLQSVALEQSLL